MTMVSDAIHSLSDSNWSMTLHPEQGPGELARSSFSPVSSDHSPGTSKNSVSSRGSKYFNSGNIEKDTTSFAEDFPVWYCLTKGASHCLRVAFTVLDAATGDDVQLDNKSLVLIREICMKATDALVLKGRFVYSNVLKRLPPQLDGVRKCRALQKSVFQDLARARRKLASCLEAINCGVVSYQKGISDLLGHFMATSTAHKALNKAELYVLAMAVRDTDIGWEGIQEMWLKFSSSRTVEEHAMMLGWIRTRKEAAMWSKKLFRKTHPFDFVRIWILWSSFRRQYEVPLLALRQKSLMRSHQTQQPGDSPDKPIFCFCFGCPTEKAESCQERPFSSMFSLKRTTSFSGNISSMPRRGSVTARDARAEAFSNAYRDLSLSVGALPASNNSSFVVPRSGSFNSSHISLGNSRSSQSSFQSSISQTQVADTSSIYNKEPRDDRDVQLAHLRSSLRQIRHDGNTTITESSQEGHQSSGNSGSHAAAEAHAVVTENGVQVDVS